MSLSWPSSSRQHRPGVEVTSSGFNCTHGPFSIHRSESQEVMGPLPPRTHPAAPAEGTVQVETWSCYEGIGPASVSKRRLLSQTANSRVPSVALASFFGGSSAGGSSAFRFFSSYQQLRFRMTQCGHAGVSVRRLRLLWLRLCLLLRDLGEWSTSRDNPCSVCLRTHPTHVQSWHTMGKGVTQH